MADSQLNARLRADAGLPTSGVIHVRTRLTADFTVLPNALARRRGSAVTVGVAAYIQSLPDGARVSITALCGHFDEGEILISRALRELEADGYLERRRERLPTGQVRTRTYFYDVPGARPDPDGDPDGGPDDNPPDPDGNPPGPDDRTGPTDQPKPPKPPEPSNPPGPRARPRPGPAAPTAAPATGATASPPGRAQDTAPEDITPEHTDSEQDGHTEPPRPQAKKPSPLAGADPRAIGVLYALRTADSRLVLSAHEAARLVPAVTAWLDAGVEARDIIRTLTARLPDPLLTRPVAILSFRLRETPLPAKPLPRPEHDEGPDLVPLYPFQTCDGCERAFRASAPGRCRDCRPGEPLLAAG